MLDTRLTSEQEQLRKTVEEFAREVVAPVSYAHDKAKTFPYEVVAGMADMGLFGLPFPEEHGGMGGDYFALCLALEELARVDQSVAITLEAATPPRGFCTSPVMTSRPSCWLWRSDSSSSGSAWATVAGAAVPDGGVPCRGSSASTPSASGS